MNKKKVSYFAPRQPPTLASIRPWGIRREHAENLPDCKGRHYFRFSKIFTSFFAILIFLNFAMRLPAYSNKLYVNNLQGRGLYHVDMVIVL